MMNKKKISIFIVGVFIVSVYGASAGSILDVNENVCWNQKNISNVSRDDELDQYQLEMEDYYVYIGVEPDIPYDYYIVEQEFKPTKKVLTRVELLICKDVYTTYDLTVSIRTVPDGPDLTSISKNSDSIPTGTFTWIEFDFEDIEVIPGNSYYIVCKTFEASNNRYEWGITIYDLYPNGTIIWFNDGDWYFDTAVDATFKTYGFNNLPPNTPIITGPSSGKPGTSYTYTFTTSLDPDGDDVSYYIEWGDSSTSGWTGFIPSGPPGYSENHSWSSKGSYTIRCKAKDEFGAESDWGELTVKIPRDKSINNLFLRFIDKYPFFFNLLQLIL